MNKPIVFLSHSSMDKEVLIRLKEALEKRSAGSIDYFLSSDGESLPLGRNWIVEVSDALKDAKLMFVFLSQISCNSKWVYFEAGYAYSKGIQVIPICLPGIVMDEVGAPLNLFQGFNLHSYQAMSNIVRTCNDVCGRTINELFTQEEYDNIFVPFVKYSDNSFGRWLPYIHDIQLKCDWTAPREYNISLDEIALGFNNIGIEVDLTGGYIRSSGIQADIRTRSTDPKREHVKYELDVAFAPDRFMLNLQPFLTFIEALPFEKSRFALIITFENAMFIETLNFLITSKLHGTEIKLKDGIFWFRNIGFWITGIHELTVKYDSPITAKSWIELLDILEKTKVLATNTGRDSLKSFNIL